MQKDIKEQFFKNIFNRKCFDCTQENPEWVSVNNAIFLCKDCQLKHRSYGVSISYIRSLELDNWKEEQLALLKLGGNERLKELMLTYNITSSVDRAQLYYSKLFDYYRKLIKAELRGDQRPKPPTDDEALESIDVSKMSNTKTSNEKLSSLNDKEPEIKIPQEENQSQSSGGLFSSVGGLVGSLWSKTKDTASLIKNKVDETGITEKVTNNTQYYYGKLKETSSEIIHKGGEIGSNVIHKTAEVGSLVINKGIEYTNTGVEYTKSKVDEVVSD